MLVGKSPTEWDWNLFNYAIFINLAMFLPSTHVFSHIHNVKLKSRKKQTKAKKKSEVLWKDFYNVWDCNRRPKLHDRSTRGTASGFTFALFSWQTSQILWTAGLITPFLRYLTMWMDMKCLYSNSDELSLAIQHSCPESPHYSRCDWPLHLELSEH